MSEGGGPHPVRETTSATTSQATSCTRHFITADMSGIDRNDDHQLGSQLDPNQQQLSLVQQNSGESVWFA